MITFDSKSWPCPAKINLFLHINRQRSDGYHDLQTVFQFLDYSDTMNFGIRNDGVIQLHTVFEDIKHEQNLIVKAAKLLQKKLDTPLGIDIQINKILPMGGGLGGGSSNAATTLVALNHLWQGQLTQHELMELGLELGADVPIFIFGQAAFAEGVGEQLQGVDAEEPWYLVIQPNVHVSTQTIFTHPELTRNTPSMILNDISWKNTHNDCQDLVAKMYPQVANALEWLLQYAPSRMTGTGACLFGYFDNKKDALNALKNKPDDCQGFVAKGSNISPLTKHLEQHINSGITASI